MFSKIRNIFTASQPPLQLKQIKPLLKDHFPYLEPLLARVDTINGVIDLIERECTLIDIKPLAVVVEGFKLVEAKRCLADYQALMEKFCWLVTVGLCLKETFEIIKMHPSLRCETAMYVFDWEPDEYNLKDINDMLSTASGELVRIKYMDKSTNNHFICITCTFPYTLVEVVKSKSSENLGMLKRKKLMKLTVGYFTVWKGKKVRLNLPGYVFCT